MFEKFTREDKNNYAKTKKVALYVTEIQGRVAFARFALNRLLVEEYSLNKSLSCDILYDGEIESIGFLFYKDYRGTLKVTMQNKSGQAFISATRFCRAFNIPVLNTNFYDISFEDDMLIVNTAVII